MARSERLHPRKVPAQPRARATVEAVLDATVQLLTEVGVDGLTTNAIAERAGINVASLYSYFPNKFAVLAAVWDRQQAMQREALGGLAQADRLAHAIDRGVDVTFEFVLTEPGFAELADAVRLVPELRELSQQAHAEAARLLRDLLAERGGPRSVAEIDAMAAVIVETVSSVLAYARRAPTRRRKQIVAELKELLAAYLTARGVD